MKISIAGKKLVVAPDFTDIWDPATGSRVQLDPVIVGDRTVFTSDITLLEEAHDLGMPSSVHLFYFTGTCPATPAIERVSKGAEKWFHTEDRNGVPSGWKTAESVSRDLRLADLAGYLRELPMGDKMPFVDALSERSCAGYLNP